MSGWAGFSDEDLRRVKQTGDHDNTNNKTVRDGDLQLGARKHVTARRGGKAQREKMSAQGRSPISATQTSSDLTRDQRLSAPLPTSMPIPNVATDRVGNGMMASKGPGADAESDMKMDTITENRIKSASEIKVETMEELNEQEALNRELNNLEKFQQQQKVIEEANKKKKELLARTITERQKRARAEANKLSHIQRELSHLDTILSADVSIIREKIESASREFMDAQKRYERIEKMFIAAKLDLQRKAEIKDQLTEHLYTVINQNEVRKAQKLGDLMKEMEMEADDVDLPDVLPLAAFNTFNQLQTIKPKKTDDSSSKMVTPVDSSSSSTDNSALSKSPSKEVSPVNDAKNCNTVESKKGTLCEPLNMTQDNLVIASVTGNKDKEPDKSPAGCENNEKLGTTDNSASDVSATQTQYTENQITSMSSVIAKDSNSLENLTSTVDNSSLSSSTKCTDNVSSIATSENNELSQDVIRTSVSESRSPPSDNTGTDSSIINTGESSDSKTQADSSSSIVPNTWRFPFGRIKEEPPS